MVTPHIQATILKPVPLGKVEIFYLRITCPIQIALILDYKLKCYYGYVLIFARLYKCSMVTRLTLHIYHVYFETIKPEISKCMWLLRNPSRDIFFLLYTRKEIITRKSENNFEISN